MKAARQQLDGTGARTGVPGADRIVVSGAGLAGTVVGTWRDNTCPGRGSDIPFHPCSFSFAPKRDRSAAYRWQPATPRRRDFTLRKAAEAAAR
ncbi:hypothetical protein AB4Z48_02590 [Cupriavidus sp. 2TAF22]|uniref:hypothetical protein n=1 Tax=unclassified Cupriavidus TaxID=2640874 RepID=UPI003F917ABE